MLNLTTQERRVIIFLAALALLGTGINLLGKNFFPAVSVSRFNQDLFKSDLNLIDQQRLTDIPGIGEKLAGRIIEYRTQNGAFSDKEELRKIKGITAKRYEKIKDYFR